MVSELAARLREVGFKVDFPHLTHPDNWQAYRMRMTAYAYYLTIDHVLNRDRYRRYTAEGTEADHFMVCLILSTVSNKIASCLKYLPLGPSPFACNLWDYLGRLMGDDEDDENEEDEDKSLFFYIRKLAVKGLQRSIDPLCSPTGNHRRPLNLR